MIEMIEGLARLLVALVRALILGVGRLLSAVFGGLWGRAPQVLSRDGVRLQSAALGLVGQPDRLLQMPNGDIIPYEKKSGADRVHRNIRRQLGAYFLLIEDVYGRRPPYGWVVLGDDRHVRVHNTEKLRQDVLHTAERIRRMRRHRLHTPAATTADVQHCRPCGFRDVCTQKRLG